MNISASDIFKLRNNVDKQMLSLKSKIEKYRDLEDKIINYKDRLSGDVLSFSFTRPDITDFMALEKLTQRYREVENERFKVIREIDNIASIIAGSLKVAIDYCMGNYSISLKQWIGKTITSMAILREADTPLLKISDFSFPTAAAILAPYLYITQTYQVPQKFALVRNAIRDLIY